MIKLPTDKSEGENAKKPYKNTISSEQSLDINRVLDNFNVQITLYCDFEYANILKKKIEKLNAGKNTTFKWKFYFYRLMPLAKPSIKEDILFKTAKVYFGIPGCKEALYKHLDEGGKNFSDNTKRLLKHLRCRSI